MTLEYTKAGFDELIGLDITSVGPDEVRRYHEAVRAFLTRTRAAVLGAGFRYALLRVPDAEQDDAAKDAALIESLYRAGMLARR